MSEPLVLSFDTAAAHCAVALLGKDCILAVQVEEMAKGQAERLFPLLESLLKTADHSWSDLDRIAVNCGPGNFTGIRIAVAAARGLSLSLNIPAIGITGFDIAAYGQTTPLTATTLAPRQQLYVQYWPEDGAPEKPYLVAENDMVTIGKHCPLEAIELRERVIRIARIAANTDDVLHPPTPLYIRPADAVISRERLPVILSDDA